MSITTALDVSINDAPRQAKRWFLSFLESNPDAMALVDAEGRIVHVNALVEELFGYRRDELLGRPLDVLIPQRFRTRHREHLERYFTSALPRRMGRGMELVGLRKNGAEFPIDVALSPLSTEAGVLVTAAIRDMTDFRQLEEDLRQRSRELEEADRRKDQFLAMLAHELRNPLAVISMIGQRLRFPLADDRLAWAADVVERQTNSMLRLVDDILDVARVRQGKVNLTKEITDITAIAVGAVETSRPLVESRKHVLEVILPPQPIWVEGDPMRLGQVITNILTNAARYTPECGQISLTVTAEDGDAVLRIRDNGVGIPGDMLTRVFDLFTQVQGPGDRSDGGLGMGLSLVQRLVEMHSGTVTAASGGAGLGSEFTVRIPLSAERPI